MVKFQDDDPLRPYADPTMIDITTNPTRIGRIGACAALAALLATAVSTPVGAATTPDPTPLPTSAAISTPALPPHPVVGGSRMAEQGIIVAPGAAGLPDVASQEWVVADATTGQILAAHNPHGRARPASTQKTLLALTMLPRLSPDATYTADHNDENVEGTRVGMVATQTYKVDDLWYALFLRSGNDAANGLAKAGAGGDLAKAVRMEQAEAQRLQAYDTTVVNPSGLDADGQYSSAYDLALFGRAGLARGDFRKYASTVRRQFPGNHTATGTPQTSKSFQIYTENRLLAGPNAYDGAIGVKPGYTTLAQNTLIAAATRNGRTIMVSEVYAPHGRVNTDAARLLDWGFAQDGIAAPVGQLVDPVSTSLLSPEDTNAGVLPVGDAAQRNQAASFHHSTPLASGQPLHWSAVAGGALLSVLALLGFSRMVRNKRRYRRAGALR
jgi:D-alanyl-D-alanine carboxypeptidase (penicillin-binding protein 5/6)